MNRLGGMILAWILVLVTGIFSVTAFQISEIGTSAEMIGKAGIEGFDHSASSLFNNPASLSKVNKFAVSAFYSDYLKNDMKYINLSYATKTKLGTFGLGLMQARVDDIYHTQEIEGGAGELEVADTFNYQNMLVKLAYQKSYKQLFNYGLNLNYYYSDLYSVEGTGVNADFGVLAYLKKFQLSISMKNFLKGSQLKYTNGNEESLPFTITPSVAYTHKNTSYYYQQVIGLNESYGLKSHQAGLTTTPPWLLNLLSVSAGIKNVEVNEKAGFVTRYTVGVSLKTSLLSFHFAMESSEYYNQSQHYFFSTDIHL